VKGRLGETWTEGWTGRDADLPDGLEGILARACVAGRDAWPGVEIDDAQFIRHLARCTPTDRPGEALGALHTADLYLACACAAGLPSAMAAFEQRFMATVPSCLRRIAGAPALADEVMQLLRTRLLIGDGGGAPRIAQYKGRGPLGRWVGIAAQRTALSLLRGEGARASATRKALADALPVGSDPEIDYLKGRYRDEFRAAFGDAIGRLATRERVLLRLHLVDGLSHERIAAMYDVNQSTVTRWIGKARESVLEETQRLLGERLGASATEVESLVALVRSELDLSLTRLLA